MRLKGHQLNELLDLEERGWEAMSSTSATEFLEQWLADDALMIVPGMVVDRDGFIAALGSEAPWKSQPDPERADRPLHRGLRRSSLPRHRPP